jgi:hypothetical protein
MALSTGAAAQFRAAPAAVVVGLPARRLGDPSVRNRLRYFAGVQRAFDQSRPAGYSGPGDDVVSDTRWLGKLNGALSNRSASRGSCSKGSTRAKRRAGRSGSRCSRPHTTSRQPQTTGHGRADLGSRAHAARAATAVATGAMPARIRIRRRPAKDQQPHRDIATGLWSVEHAYWFDGRRTRYTDCCHAHALPGWSAGDHDLRAGLDHERSFMQNHYGDSGRHGVQYDDGGALSYRSNLELETPSRPQRARVRKSSLADKLADWHASHSRRASAWMSSHVSLPLQDDAYATTPISPG